MRAKQKHHREIPAASQETPERKRSGMRPRIHSDEGQVVAFGAVPAPAVTVVGTLHLLRSQREIAMLPLDPKIAFVLSQVDGRRTIDEILDVCAMPEREALAIVRHLVRLGIVGFGPGVVRSDAG